ncbi:MAG: adenine phosphoribosyltransferase [Paludibacteraceae bacterium]|nr:adenine phosphoribosyltransferase [Paludibacteraceae bacterium]MDY5076713.1 adenine phosphoribosyltransferase [Paludibacteraceae bacterium]
MTAEEVKLQIRNIPDFPVKGIQFKDITTALQQPECLRWMRDEMVNLYKDKGITKIVGIESRGFIIAPAVAMELGVGFVPIRKPGKLPAETVEISYQKEYGVDTIQMHKDALCADDVVLLHDDLLATGGTMAAAIELVKKFGVKKVYVNFLIELDFLNGRQVLEQGAEVDSLIHM